MRHATQTLSPTAGELVDDPRTLLAPIDSVGPADLVEGETFLASLEADLAGIDAAMTAALEAGDADLMVELQAQAVRLPVLLRAARGTVLRLRLAHWEAQRTNLAPSLLAVGAGVRQIQSEIDALLAKQTAWTGVLNEATGRSALATRERAEAKAALDQLSAPPRKTRRPVWV